MRICSLLPSNTEILFSLGLGDSIVGVTHECDYPEEAATKPVVTSSVVDGEHLASREISAAISSLLHKGSSIYHLDENRLRESRTELILTQELCDVCAVSYKVVKAAARVLDSDVKVVSLEPNNIQDILDNIMFVGELTGSLERAGKVVAELTRRIETVKSQASQVQTRPRVLCMEWLEPIFVGGHWVPEMVDLAGGEDGMGEAGRPSIQVDWDLVAAYAPEVIVLMPCGFGVSRVLQELEHIRLPDQWEALPAVQQGNVFAVDGSSYFNRPGPRIIDGLEILAEIIHPELFPGKRRTSKDYVRLPAPYTVQSAG